MMVPVVLVIAGCRGSQQSPAQTGNATMYRNMGAMYSQYVAEHGNQPPPSEQAFREFLGSKRDELEKSGLTVEKMFVSPRNGQPMEWMYKKVPTGPMGMTYFAYEKEPVDGQRLALANRGMYELMDEAKFRSVFSNVTK